MVRILTALNRNSSCLLLLIITFLSTPNGLGEKQKETWSDWLCRVLGIRKDVYLRLGAVRGVSDSVGKQIIKFSIPGQTESVIWECGECWSLTRTDSQHLAVIKRDGVWIINISGGPSPRKAIVADHLQRILGVVGTKLLILKENAASTCPSALLIGDLATASIGPAKDVPADCITQSDASFVNATAILDDQLLLAIGEPPRTICVRQIKEDEKQPLCRPIGPIAGQKNRSDPSALEIDRFDPTWLSKDEIAYLGA